MQDVVQWLVITTTGMAFVGFILLCIWLASKQTSAQPIDNDSDDGIAGLPGEEPGSY